MKIFLIKTVLHQQKDAVVKLQATIGFHYFGDRLFVIRLLVTISF